MKNLFARFVSIACVLAMLFTVCPTVLADDAALTAEAIAGSQATNAITENMTLPTGYTWESSNEDVIEIDGSTAKVNRPISSNATVTLTATPTAGGDAQTFEFTVLSKMATILEQNSFYNMTYSDSGWSGSYGSLDSSTGDQYMKIDFTGIDNPGGVTHTFAPDADEFIIEFDFIWTPATKQDGDTNEPETSFDLYFNVAPNGTDSTKTGNHNAFRAFRVRDSAVQYIGIGSKTLDNTKAVFSKTLNSGWNHIAVKINQSNSTVRILNDDGTWSDAAKCIGDDYLGAYQGGKLVDVRFVRGAGANRAGLLSVDNWVSYTESINNLAPTEKIEYVSNDLNKELLTSESSGVITDDLDLDTFGGLVSWKSSDDAVIETDGTVTRSTYPVAKPVTLTATILPDDEENKTERKFSFEVAPQDTKAVNADTGTNGGTMVQDFETDITINQTNIAYNNADYKTTIGAADANSAKAFTNQTLKYQQKESAERGGKVLELSSTATSTAGVKVVTGAYNSLQAERYTAGVDFKWTAPESATGERGFVWTVSAEGDVVKLYFDFGGREIQITHTTNTNIKTIAMPDYIQPGQWIHVDADINLAGASQEIYVNGQKLIDLPMDIGNTDKRYHTHSVRYMCYSLAKSGTVELDNIRIMKFSDSAAVKADAAVKRALIEYADKVLIGGTVLPTTINLPVATGKTLAVSSVSGLSWSGANVTNNVLDAPTKLGEKYALTVTGTSGTKTATANVNVVGAPVILTKTGATADDMAVTATGNTTGGKLIIITYNDAEQTEINNVTIHDTFANVPVNATNFRALFWNNMDGLKPLAYAVK